MQLPNKLFSYEESTFSKFPIILKVLQSQPRSVVDLYHLVARNFESTFEFIEALDALFALNRIEFNDESEKLEYVEGN
ncbi:TPA: ABC-three component system middle component 7 [Streptococcus suis]|nr:hypothetical protein [Streptococcus suis]